MLPEILYGFCIVCLILSFILILIGRISGGRALFTISGVLIIVSIVLFGFSYYYDGGSNLEKILRYATIGLYGLIIALILMEMISRVKCDNRVASFASELYKSYEVAFNRRMREDEIAGGAAVSPVVSTADGSAITVVPGNSRSSRLIKRLKNALRWGVSHEDLANLTNHARTAELVAARTAARTAAEAAIAALARADAAIAAADFADMPADTIEAA